MYGSAPHPRLLQGLAIAGKMWSSVRVTDRRRHTLIATLIACLSAIALLIRPILSMDSGVWGPADPWNNGDFLGAQWLFWAVREPVNPTALLHWPWGEDGLFSAFPNPFDALVIGPWVGDLPTHIWWNGMMLGHHLLNIAATVGLARAAGARPVQSALAGILVAATPLMLHEHAMGHTLTAALWPGLFGLRALLRDRPKTAGLWIGVQGLAYLYTGLFVGLIAILLRPRAALLTAAIPIIPYAAFLAPQLEAATAVPPPDGFTALPLDALIGQSSQLQLRLHPFWMLAAAGVFWGNRSDRGLRMRLLTGSLCLLFVAMGTAIVPARGMSPIVGSPTAWLVTLPGLERMHHPVRLAMLAVPLLATVTALALNRRRSAWAVGLALACGLNWKIIDNAAAWPAPAEPPGAETAQWLANHANAVVDLGSTHMQAMALQTIHGKPILSGFHPRNRPHPSVDTALFERVEGWASGTRQPGLPEHLRRLGYSHVVVIDRGPNRTPDDAALRADLGPPIRPGVFAL